MKYDEPTNQMNGFFGFEVAGHASSNRLRDERATSDEDTVNRRGFLNQSLAIMGTAGISAALPSVGHGDAPSARQHI